MAFFTLTGSQLACASGGIQMRLDQYGYRGEPYQTDATKQGQGYFHRLQDGKSVMLSRGALHALGLTPAMVRQDHPWVDIRTQGGGVLHRRIDDWNVAGSRNAATLYTSGGRNDKLASSADVSLSR